jgi:hypothetical protein
MKQLLFLFFVFTAAPFVVAQDLLEKMAADACACLERKNFAELPEEKLVMEAGLCILEFYGEHQQDVNEYFGIDEFNGETGRMIGQRLGLKMVNVCPDLVIRLGESQSPKGRSENNSTYSIEGKVTKIEEGDFISYHIKDDGGKSYKVLWYKNFSGSDEWVGDPKKLVGKRARITVRDIECYIPKAKGYFSIKEIQEIKLI